MDCIINGGNALCGNVDIGSAKNCVLVQLASCILVEGVTVIKNVDLISDVVTMLDILDSLGCYISISGKDISVDATEVNCCEISVKHATKLRASVFLLGALIGRLGKATTYLPGGCAIGSRPIDIHISALRKLGVSIVEEGNKLVCTSSSIVGNDIVLPMPTVGGTENAIMCAVLAKGTTNIYNCALEPEVVALQNSLVEMGADIANIGNRHIVVRGVDKLHGSEITPISDRIVTATYIVAMCMTRGNGVINNCQYNHVQPLLDIVRDSGVLVSPGKNSITIVADNRYDSLGSIITAPYPGFATDMQSLVLSMATIARGRTTITESMFEDRLLNNATQLCHMGADIIVDNNVATINGIKQLCATSLQCGDLRGGAGLILAALAANGSSKISDMYHVDRGYYHFIDNLVNLGADISVI